MMSVSALHRYPLNLLDAEFEEVMEKAKALFPRLES
jgi:hypothetical protein